MPLMAIDAITPLPCLLAIRDIFITPLAYYVIDYYCQLISFIHTPRHHYAIIDY